MKASLLELLPNRVRRNYAGGALLAQWAEGRTETDGGKPEDWLASTTPAVNPGMEVLAQEGIGRVRDASGEVRYLTELFTAHGEYYLGRDHLARLGPNLGFLAKLLDSSMRLHTQAHPTRAFARERLGSPWGKLECYVILGTRPGYPADVRLGFQHAPSRAQWRDIIETQDIARMDACFEPMPVKPGEVWLVPGGMVHALGAGLLLLEIMEPSDLVVRCEFEREGLVVPPAARFMGRGLDFCLDIFDYTTHSTAEVQRRCRMQPNVVTAPAGAREECWVSFEKTDCFEVRRLQVSQPVKLTSPGFCRLILVTGGEGFVRAGGESLALRTGMRVLLAAGGEPVTLHLEPGAPPLELSVVQSQAGQTIDRAA